VLTGFKNLYLDWTKTGYLMDLRKYLCTGTPNLPEATLEGVLQQPTLNQSYPTPLSTPFIDPRKVENYCWHNPQVLQSTAKR